MWNDLRYALRLQLKAPGFSLLTILTLSAGIAFAIYMYAVAHAIGFAHLPWPNFERLAAINELFDGRTNGDQVRYAAFVEFQKNQTHFEQLLPGQSRNASIGTARLAESFRVYYTSPGMWAIHGVQPIMGRTLQGADSEAGAPLAVVINADIWKKRLGGDASIIGSHIKVNGVTGTIVGIMPAGFRFPTSEQIWLPFKPPVKYAPGDDNRVSVMGWLKPDASLDDASNEIGVMAKRQAAEWGKASQNLGAKIVPFVHGNSRAGLGLYLTLGGAAGLLLMLTWINTSNLLLARSNERQQEITIRAALGAPQHRLVRQMVCEGLILSLVAAAIAICIAGWTLDLSSKALMDTPGARDFLPFWFQFGIGWRESIVAILLAVLTTVMVGLVPARNAVKLDVMQVLRDGTRHGQSKSGSKFSSFLVIAQIALSCTLLVAACVLPWSIYQIARADYGCRTHDIATARLALNGVGSTYTTDALRAQYWQRLERGLAAQSGGLRLALGDTLPGDGMSMGAPMYPEAMVVNKGHEPVADRYVVNGDYFRTLDIKLIQGRTFTQDDRLDTLPVAVVDSALATSFWPKASPIGKRVYVMNDPDKAGHWVTVVGVVTPVLHGAPSGTNERGLGTLFQPISQSIPTELSIAVAGPDVQTAIQGLSAAVQLADSAIAPSRLMSFDELHDANQGGFNILAAWCVALGLISLLLATSGIYGMTARSVALRTWEVGLRRSVGASDSAILRMLVKRGVRQLLIGLPTGLLMGWGVTIAMQEFLYRSELAIPLAIVLIAMVISSVLFMAILIPARRAIALTPNAALRYE
ncbi:ABC transporter permease [Burkholderiaceae bacterium DAT-1]|nr:ABC transporter permease [Burkholderiaceae bacterium DAT-1]